MTVKFSADRYSRDGVHNAVSITPTATGLSVSNNHGTSDSIAYCDLELVPAGYLSKITTLKVAPSQETVIANDFRFLKELSRMSSGQLKQQIDERLKQHGKDSMAIHGGWTGVAVVVILLICGAFSATDLLADKAMAYISPSLEIQLGNLEYESFKSSHSSSSDTAAAKRVAAIGVKLCKQFPNCVYPLQFHVAKSDVVNAFAIPGGNIVVLSKLVDTAGSDDELAGVMAHEIGHVVKRHSLRAALHDAGAIFCLELIFKGRGRDVHTMLKNVLKMDELRFSRAQETEADEIGVRLSHDAGYDPQALITFFQKLKKDESAVSSMTDMFSTHPLTQDRIANIQRLIKNQPDSNRSKRLNLE